MRRGLSVRRTRVSTWLVALLMSGIAAAGGDASASRAELERWFGSLRATRDMAAPQRWEYSFVAADGHALELLSVALVRDGYEIAKLDANAGPSLRMTKTELLSPLTLEQRNQALRETARKHQARYVGVDVAN